MSEYDPDFLEELVAVICAEIHLADGGDYGGWSCSAEYPKFTFEQAQAIRAIRHKYQGEAQ